MKQTTLFILLLFAGMIAIWRAHLRAAGFQNQIEVLEVQEPSPRWKAALAREHDEARAELKRVTAESEKLKSASADLLKLRGEATALRSERRGLQAASTRGVGAQPADEGVPTTTLESLVSNVTALKAALQKAPEQQVPELAFLEEQDWIKAAREAKMDTEEDVAKSLGHARTLAKEKWIPMLSTALLGYVKANNGQLPTALTQLEPFLDQPVDPSIFDRYELIKTGDSGTLKPGDMVIRERNRLTSYDSIFRLGLFGWGSNGP